MSAKDGQGQSSTTDAKERGIGAALSVSMDAFTKIRGFQRFRYLHFDLNAGCGINDEVGCDGSPLVFLERIRAKRIDGFAAHFCEIDKERISQLIQRPELHDDDRIVLHHGNNRGLLPAVPEIIRAYRENPEFAAGSILADPNSTDIPIAELIDVSESCPRLDLFINWNATAFKRLGRGKYLVEALNALKPHRAHWLIRKPLGNWHFTMLIGRNFKAGEHRAMGFYDLESDFGQYHLRVATETAEEIKATSGQHALPGLSDVFASSAVSRDPSGGVQQSKLDL